MRWVVVKSIEGEWGWADGWLEGRTDGWIVGDRKKRERKELGFPLLGYTVIPQIILLRMKMCTGKFFVANRK